MSMDRGPAALTGALVADAASMGFHWLYDQPRIAALAGDAPEFHTPNEADYRGADGKGLGYFAHGGKRAGDLTHYGAQMLSMASGLTCYGAYDAEACAAAFQDWFGYGGRWHGYIDRPTRATLDAMGEAAARGAPLATCGADDAQLPALSRIPPLVVRHRWDADLMDKVESAVRLTNNRDDSVAWGQAAARMLLAALTGVGGAEVVAAARGVSLPIDAEIDAALALQRKTPEEAAVAFGLHCQLEVAFPVILHSIATAADYQSAIRANIRAGGDSAGRAMLLGAVLGAMFADDPARGVPVAWRARVNIPGDLAALF